MKKYRLKQWYPSLAISWRTGDRYEYDADRRVMTNISNVKNGLAMPKEMVVKEQEIHPDFWELIEEEKPKPLFVTDDGVEVFEGDSYYTVTKPYFAKTELKAKEMPYENSDFKYFFHESNADEYIWRNKPVFSYEDFIRWGNVPYQIAIEQLAKERIEQ